SRGCPRRAWPYQIIAPPAALFTMRGSAQRATNRTTIRLLKEAWQRQGTCIETLHAAVGSDDAPMSWHLTNDEQKAIDSRWNEVVGAPILEAVTKYLAGSAATTDGAQCLATIK